MGVPAPCRGSSRRQPTSSWCSAASPSPTPRAATASWRRAIHQTTTSHPTTCSRACSNSPRAASFCEWKGRPFYFTALRRGDGPRARVGYGACRRSRRCCPRRVLRGPHGHVLRRRRARAPAAGRLLRRLDHVDRHRTVQEQPRLRAWKYALASNSKFSRPHCRLLRSRERRYLTRRDMRRSASTLSPVWRIPRAVRHLVRSRSSRAGGSRRKRARVSRVLGVRYLEVLAQPSVGTTRRCSATRSCTSPSAMTPRAPCVEEPRPLVVVQRLQRHVRRQLRAPQRVVGVAATNS